MNQSRTPCINESLTDTDADNVPTTPPPSYEHVLEENTRLSQHQRQLSLDSATPNQNSRRSSANSSRHSAAQLSAALEQLTGGGSSGSNSICNDPDCVQNLNQNYTSCNIHNGNSNSNSGNGNGNGSHSGSNNNNDGEQIIEGVTELELRSDLEEEEQLSINEFLLESEMAASPSRGRMSGNRGECSDDQCVQCSEGESHFDGDGASTSSQAAAAAAAGGHSFYDPLLNRGSYSNYNDGKLESLPN